MRQSCQRQHRVRPVEKRGRCKGQPSLESVGREVDEVQNAEGLQDEYREGHLSRQDDDGIVKLHGVHHEFGGEGAGYRARARG